MLPIQTAFEVESRECFRALMWALSYPGQTQTLPLVADPRSIAALAACARVGRTLLDLETSHFTNDRELGIELARTGSAAQPAAQAAYIFFPRWTEADVPLVEQANIGDEVYPDNGATLIIGCQLNPRDALGASTLQLSGPGIQSEQTLKVAGLPSSFWELRERRIRYPLGLDLFLLDGPTVVGLPRTTHITYA